MRFSGSKLFLNRGMENVSVSPQTKKELSRKTKSLTSNDEVIGLKDSFTKNHARKQTAYFLLCFIFLPWPRRKRR